MGRSKFEYYFKDTEGEVLSRIENPEYVKEQYERYIYMSELNREVLKENVPELGCFFISVGLYWNFSPRSKRFC